MSPVIDVSEATFPTEVLERSKQTPVVVDFWAEWCGPCRTLGPLLERLADEADGEWILAKVDVDANQQLAAAFGVQGIPAVHGFRDGRPIASFVGALPEPQVREWLTQLGPSPADLAVQRAIDAEANGNLQGALDAFREAVRHEPARAEALAGISRLEALARAADVDEPALRARIEADPSDLDAARGLADALFARGEVDEGADVLLECVRRSTDDARDEARVHLVALLDALPPDDPRAIRARRDLASALF